ncbi:MAG: DUF2007 domain-containing protein, partial [Planctomycetes bacterium]|nr:DUF2007 domain-containing protein [Planctomycetota bacterium]
STRSPPHDDHLAKEFLVSDVDSELVLLTTAGNIFEAHLLKGILADHGVPAYIPGENAMDEWSAPARTMSIRIEVRRSDLARATEIVDEERARANDRRGERED